MDAPSQPALQIGDASPDRGRGLFAAQAFRPGQTIQVFDRPLLALTATPLLERVCSHCLRVGEKKPRGCSRCCAAFYCDAVCQSAAWAAVHGRECKALGRKRLRLDGAGGGLPARLPTPVRALVQALVCPDVETALGSLQGHRPCDGALTDLLVMARAGCAFAGVEAGEKGTGAGAGLMRAVELLCKIQTNAFHRYDADLGQAGIFLEPTLAMANHSCIPNALVHFVGRTAILTAERPIEPGDEVEISYTDYTYPLAKRGEALSSYGFDCRCQRCKEDLNVYQVRFTSSPDAILDNACLVSPDDFFKLRSHPAIVDPATQSLARTDSETAVKSFESRPSSDEAPSTRRQMLLAQLRDCAGLATAGLWAVTPVPQILTELSINYAERGDFASALALACFIATSCDPYRYTACFHPTRIKNVLVVAKMLANTAEETAALSQAVERVTSRPKLERKLRETLRDIDQASLCQMLLIMVLQSVPAGRGGAEWELAMAARDMLRDIEQLPGRDQEVSLITAWTRDPTTDQSRAFFDYAVVQRVDILAGLGRELLLVDLDTET
ncbi:hypothetical protein XA68_16673 [Ophiocordyceps unilateralis]|uniref:Uncharacterized protein n=1 Tax=Ophiocordyceps unilateralis TaxID=268505 RepID=A0A2A9PL92_OPHUN|nr:hypothetical protein XA68_16673 [Ophiocordyceps unilateralis]